MGLRELLTARSGVTVHLAYRGIIGRAENRALVRYLDHPLRRLQRGDLLQMPILLVDTQPGAGNNALLPGSDVVAVFDHHPWRDASGAVDHVDVRPQLGATSTIVTQYLRAAGVDVLSQLATALFYGIKTDTMGLARGASQEDVDAYFFLQSRIDVNALVGIERAQVSAEYFRGLDAALHSARMHGDVVLAYVGAMGRPDMAAEMADFLLRLRGAEWVVCSGVYKDLLVLSVRTRRRGGAGPLAQGIVGQFGTAGGHGSMAGGQIALNGQDPGLLAQQLDRLALEYLDIDPTAAGTSVI
jgi:nanoRNase/pAp phosphatase (c-di-AMP/oligoRNAs hydrolase)